MGASFFDSSFWIALYLDSDTHHEKAVDVLKKIKGQVFISNLIFAEVVTVLTYKHSREQSDKFIDFIRKSNDITYLNYDLNDLLNFHLSHKYKISFPGSSILFLAKNNSFKLFTFDNELEKLQSKKPA